MESKRMGVVGVGHLGQHHARIYTEILGSQLVGVMDENSERAAAIGQHLGVPYYDDLNEFFRDLRLDGISVVVPTTSHFSVAKEALSRGINVLVEKPVTTTVGEAEELLSLAEPRGLVLQVGHIERFNSAIQYVSKISNHPMFLQSRRLGPFSPRISDVGVVMDLMIHDIDIVLSLVKSPISSISAMGSTIRSDHEDIASAQLAFENGAMAHILVSRVSERRLRQMEIMEPERYLSINYETQDVSIHRCINRAGSGLVEIVEHPIFPKSEPLKLELQHFVTCIRDGKQPLVGISDGRKALGICIEALKQIHGSESSKGRKPLCL